jgi:small subunit ribosomal protein S20
MADIIAQSRVRADLTKSPIRLLYKAALLFFLKGVISLANLKSSIKRIRQSKKRELRNSAIQSRARTAVKKANRLVAEGRLDEATEAAKVAASALDRAVSKGVVHGNNADRRKSRLMKRIKSARSANA